MSFFETGNDNELPGSTYNFVGDPFDFEELKERFNKDFIRRSNCILCKISFLGNNIKKDFVAGYRNDRVVIIDTLSKQEYSPAKFSKELRLIDSFLSNRQELASFEAYSSEC